MPGGNTVEHLFDLLKRSVDAQQEQLDTFAGVPELLAMLNKRIDILSDASIATNVAFTNLAMLLISMEVLPPEAAPMLREQVEKGVPSADTEGAKQVLSFLDTLVSGAEKSPVPHR